MAPPDLHIRAWQLAKACGLPRVYDMHYAALAESQRCPLYTADQRLVRALGPQRPWAHWVVGESGQ